jgi:hypothetical protein
MHFCDTSKDLDQKLKKQTSPRKKNPLPGGKGFNTQYPIQDVAPRAVRMAVATEAIICTIHLKVSFFVIIVHF